MNKKFLSAILFGALMVSSTGTFVSCKDYDDDIETINDKLTDLKSKLDALQTKVDAGKYITNVATTADGITITLDDGTSYPITNGKDGEAGKPGEAGAAGDKVEINEEGFFIINGKATEWKAVAKDATTGEAIKIKTPTVSENGCWVFYDEKGEAHPTTIKVAPVTAVENADKTWTLTVWDTKGGKQEIIVPTAASSLTDLILVTRADGATTDNAQATLNILKYEFKYNQVHPHAEAPAANKWLGQRPIVENGFIFTSAKSIKIQVNPTKVDAADLNLKLIDSENNYVSNLDLIVSPYTKLEVFSSAAARAANANGLYTLASAEKYFKETSAAENYANQFKKDGNQIAYAVTAGTDVRSKYEVAVTTANSTNQLSQFSLQDPNGGKVKFTNNTEYFSKYQPLTGDENNANGKLEPNVWYTLVPEVADAFYDAHLVFSNDDKTLFGIETEEKDGAIKIRLTKTPDNITKAAFKLIVQNIDKYGNYNQTSLWLGQSSTINNGYKYDLISHKVSKNNSAAKQYDVNFFQIDLAKMKEALGEQGTALWNTKVTTYTVNYYDGNTEITDPGIALTFVKKLKNNLRDLTASDNVVADDKMKDAKNLAFVITNSAAGAKFAVNKEYTAKITFKAGADVLNTITVPFKFTLPAITDLFVIDPGFIVNNEAICYLYKDDFDNHTTFMLSRIFKDGGFDAKGFNIKLNNQDKVGETDMTSAQLACFNYDETVAAAEGTQAKSTAIDATELAMLTLEGNLGREPGYNETLKLTIDGKYDGAWSYPEGEGVFNFQVKVLSPIAAGKIVPKEGNVVNIDASDLNGYNFGNDVIIGYTYNSKVSYKVMPDKVVNPAAPAWSREEITNVTAVSGNRKYFDVLAADGNVAADGVGVPTPAAYKKDAQGNLTTEVIEGALKLKGYNVPQTPDRTSVVIKVVDMWGRTLESVVPVQIHVGK